MHVRVEAHKYTHTHTHMHSHSQINLTRVLEEISEVLGERKTVTADDLEQLKYLEQVNTISYFNHCMTIM